MKVLLILSVLVTVTIASPCSSSRSVTITKTTYTCDRSYYPKIIPDTWIVKTFDSVCATLLFRGVWFLQMATPVCMKGQTALHTGLFSTCYPSCNNRVFFWDTTPECPGDFNTDYIFLDSSFNLATQCIENTRSLLKGAYGSTCPLAIFNVLTEKYYPTPVTDLDDLIDDDLNKHTCSGNYKRDYTLACIGADDDFQEYMVFVVINKYDNIFCGNDKHFIWVFTRDIEPSQRTCKKAIDDIIASGLSPKYLVSIDQSVVLSDVPTVTEDDINGVVETTTTVTTTTTTESITTDADSEIDADYSVTTITTVSTVEITTNEDYTIPYEYDFYEYCGNIKILKNLQPVTIREALSGSYYLYLATPCLLDETDDAKIGLLNTAIPGCSIQVMFDTKNEGPWDYNTPIMMMDRGLNAMTGDISITRSILGSAFDGSHPYGTFIVFNEGYYHDVNLKVTTITAEGIIMQPPGELYRDSYMVCIAGYQPDDFLLITIADTYKNLFFDNDDVNLFYVLTRKRIVPQHVIETINQELCRCGYNSKYLISIDQTIEITKKFVFEESFFQYSYTSTTVPSNSIYVDTYSDNPDYRNLKPVDPQPPGLSVSKSIFPQIPSPSPIPYPTPEHSTAPRYIAQVPDSSPKPCHIAPVPDPSPKPCIIDPIPDPSPKPCHIAPVPDLSPKPCIIDSVPDPSPKPCIINPVPDPSPKPCHIAPVPKLLPKPCHIAPVPKLLPIPCHIDPVPDPSPKPCHIDPVPDLSPKPCHITPVPDPLPKSCHTASVPKLLPIPCHIDPVPDHSPKPCFIDPVPDPSPKPCHIAPVPKLLPKPCHIDPVPKLLPIPCHIDPVPDPSPKPCHIDPVPDPSPKPCHIAPVADPSPKLCHIAPVPKLLPIPNHIDPVPDLSPKPCHIAPVPETSPKKRFIDSVPDPSPKPCHIAPVPDPSPKPWFIASVSKPSQAPCHIAPVPGPLPAPSYIASTPIRSSTEHFIAATPKPYPTSQETYSNARSSRLTQTSYSSVFENGLPKICPTTWKIKTFNSKCATQLFQGVWYLQMATPISMRSQYALQTGLFSNCYPCSNNRVLFFDTTPECFHDFNPNYYMIDSSFNLATQRIETTQSLLKSAYGNNLAIFSVITKKYYPTPMNDLEALIDDQLLKHTCDDVYERQYILAVIGCDSTWHEYMVMVVINKYDNIYCGNDNRIILVFTRDINPNCKTYEKAYNDIKLSGLCPKYLMCIDQSIVLKDVPTVTSDDIEGVIQTTTVTTTTTKSITTSSDSDIDSTSSSTTTTSTTISTVEIPTNVDYIIPYEYDFYEYCGNVKILKNLQPDVIKDAFSGKWYVNLATPCVFDESDDSRIGLFNTAFPGCSLEVIFDSANNCPWDYQTPIMMLDRGYNVITGEISMTRNILGSAFDASHPFGTFMVHTEGYYHRKIPKVTAVTPEGIIMQSPGPLYRDSYMACIAGYQSGDFLLITIADKYNNLFYDDDDVNLFYVLTRQRIVPLSVIETINQELCRCGYSSKYLMNIDQTIEIKEDFNFDPSYFEYSSTTTVTTTTITTTSSSSVITSSDC